MSTISKQKEKEMLQTKNAVSKRHKLALASLSLSAYCISESLPILA